MCLFCGDTDIWRPFFTQFPFISRAGNVSGSGREGLPLDGGFRLERETFFATFPEPDAGAGKDAGKGVVSHTL